MLAGRRSGEGVMAARDPATGCHGGEECHRGRRPKGARVAGRRLGCQNAGLRPVVGCRDAGGDQLFLIGRQMAGDGAQETAIERTAGQLVPLFAFESPEVPLRDARGRGKGFGETPRASRLWRRHEEAKSVCQSGKGDVGGALY